MRPMSHLIPLIAVALTVGSCTGASLGGQSSGGDETAGSCDMAEVSEVAACPSIVGEGFCSQGRVHVDEGSDVQWNHNPPHSGDHYPSWVQWGVYDEPVNRGNWVHNMEHGGVVLAYDCPDGCDEELAELFEVYDARMETSIVITPDPLLEGSRFAAVSWTWVYTFDDPDVDTLLCFVDQHFDHAPESIP